MSNLDQIVKGAPPPGKLYPIPTTTPITPPDPVNPNGASVADPLASVPSSPPQIYLNLLILEASLRAQWLELRTRRRQHTFFLTLLGLWITYFAYALFLKPREDGSGVGGSIYWVVEVTEKVCLMGGIVTGILVWGTGQWDRGIRWPRRWVYTTNRGLRGFSCKVVVIKQSVWREILSTISFIFSYGLFSGSTGSSYRYISSALLKESEKGQRGGGHHALPNIHEDDEAGIQEDLAPGGDYIKVLLLPKPFSPNFRENWDIYRTEYWEKENERRALLRQKIKDHDRKIAKEQGGWLWWTGYRGFGRGKTPDPEKTHHSIHHKNSHSHLDKDYKRTRSGSIRSGSHSRNSSRSTTPTVDLDEAASRGHVRRGSNASTTSDRRRKKSTTTNAASSRVPKLTPTQPAMPEAPSPLANESSFSSVSSADKESGVGEDSTKPPESSSRLAGSQGRRQSSGRTPKQT